MSRFLSLCALMGMTFSAPGVGAQQVGSPTKVFLNGVPTPVYFNDGDSFKVLAGQHKGVKARTAGFNTLESYGPCHQWGGWTMEELERYATLGTLNARRGVWHCTGDPNDKDGYGRMLWDCKDLAVDQVRKGLAHAMTVTSDPAAAPLVEAQKEAIQKRRGIWSHGVPTLVMTSLHSHHERPNKTAYNRRVSSADGHSDSWKHTDNYRECQTVCDVVTDVDAGKVTALVAALRASSSAAVYQAYNDEELSALVTEFAGDGHIKTALKDESARWAFETPIVRAIADGKTSTSGQPLACMIYVEFKRRYGDARAECLR